MKNSVVKKVVYFKNIQQNFLFYKIEIRQLKKKEKIDFEAKRYFFESKNNLLKLTNFRENRNFIDKLKSQYKSCEDNSSN